MYTVIGYPGTRAFRILWMLEELDQPYALDPVMPGSEAARLATGGRLPGLRLDDGTVLIDSVAILQFLADRHGRLSAPPASIERARQDEWTVRIIEYVDVPLSVMLNHLRLLPPEERVVDLSEAAEKVLENALDNIARDMGVSPFLCGNQITVPDIVFGHCLRWSARFFGRKLKQKRLIQYLRVLEKRQAYRLAEAA